MEFIFALENNSCNCVLCFGGFLFFLEETFSEWKSENKFSLRPYAGSWFEVIIKGKPLHMRDFYEFSLYFVGFAKNNF